MNNLDVKKIREELSYTQQEIANELKVNVRTVQKWESGEVKIRKSTELAINNLRLKDVNKGGVLNEELFLEKDGVKLTGDEIAIFVAKNEEYFMEKIIFSNIVEKRVGKRLIEITQSEESFKKYITS